MSERLAQLHAAWHDASLYVASHPLPWLLAGLSRRIGRVHGVPLAGTMVNDPDVARAILLDDDVFLKSGPGSLGDVITQVMGPYALLNMDGAEHRALREKLKDLFTPAYVETLIAAVVAPLLHELRARLIAGDTVDLVREMRVLTGRMTCHMLGIQLPTDSPEAAEQTYLRMVELGDRLTSFLQFRMRPLSPERLAVVRAPFEELVSYARTSYDSETADPNAIVSRLRRLGLSFDEAKGVLAILFLVGTQTTATAIPRIVALLADTGSWGRLRAQRDLVAGAVDEGLRYTTPTPVTLRVPTRDTTVLGHRFRAARRAMIFTRNLARDPRYYPQPGRFNPARVHDPRVRHLWFGGGPHFCLGFALARQEMRATLESLLDAMDERDTTLRVVRRRAARRVFLPQYETLAVALRR